MITDRDLADLCAASYHSFTDPSAVTWDLWESGFTNDGVAYGVKTIDGRPVVCFPGSRVFLDWRRDLDVWPDAPKVHQQLGHLHPGFYHGMEVTWAKLGPLLRSGPPPIYVGHSLGAARANVMSALSILDGMPVAAKVLFGEPKAGMAQLSSITGKITGRTYRNGGDRFHDQVTDVPYYLPPLLCYEHDRDFTLVDAEPPALDSWGFFAWHHIELYASETPTTVVT